MEAIKKKQVEGITSKGTSASSSADAAAAAKGERGHTGGNRARKRDERLADFGGPRASVSVMQCNCEGCTHAHPWHRPDEILLVWSSGRGAGLVRRLPP